MLTEVSSRDLHKARQSAKRNRTSVACVRCNSSKYKCSDFRPCKQCSKTGERCIERVTDKKARLDPTHDRNDHGSMPQNNAVSTSCFQPTIYSQQYATNGLCHKTTTARSMSIPYATALQCPRDSSPFFYNQQIQVIIKVSGISERPIASAR